VACEADQAQYIAAKILEYREALDFLSATGCDKVIGECSQSAIRCGDVAMA
jgi:hypothetical protein